MTHARHWGFTLVELLIVVVIGILVTMAIPRFQSTKGKAYLASVKSDLKNLSTAEESLFYGTVAPVAPATFEGQIGCN